MAHKGRILTARHLLRHMARSFPRASWNVHDRKKFAALVAHNSNTCHDRSTGFLRYRTGTPAWVRRAAKKYGFHAD